MAEAAHGQDMVGFGDKLLPLTGRREGLRDRSAATSSITLTCETETSPPEPGITV